MPLINNHQANGVSSQRTTVSPQSIQSISISLNSFTKINGNYLRNSSGDSDEIARAGSRQTLPE